MAEKLLTANGVRRAFVDFFTERDHHHEPSGSLIPHDRTLLFTVAAWCPSSRISSANSPPPGSGP